jgi:DNA-directed RNA polymerase subunit RPC12/RpoP
MEKYRRRPIGVRSKQGTRRQQAQFEQLQATELYCPKCQRAMPVRERLLLVLPEGDKYEYLCARCGTSVGDKIDRGAPKPILIV